MSFSELMPGDVFPIVTSSGENETWEVTVVNAKSDSVDLTLTLVPGPKPMVHPAEVRRLELLEPHSAIKTCVPDDWMTI